MDEHVKAWITEKVARELNPPPKPKPRFEDPMNLRWDVFVPTPASSGYKVIRPDTDVIPINCI